MTPNMLCRFLCYYVVSICCIMHFYKHFYHMVVE